MNSDIKVKTNNSSPSNRAVGILLYKGHNNTLAMNTGIMVGLDLVLTTTSSIYSLQTQRYNKDFGDIYFLPGAHGKTKEAYRVIDCRFVAEYRQATQVTKRFHECALLKLQKKVQNGQFLTLGINYEHSNDNQLRLIGYSVDNCNGFESFYQSLSSNTSDIGSRSIQAVQQQLKNNSWWNIDKKVDKTVLYQHKFETNPGSGGSPILLSTKKESVVVAMHIMRRGQGDIRVARLITTDTIQKLCRWAKEMNCDSPVIKYIKQDCYLTGQNFKKKYEQLSSVNEKLMKSNNDLREQNGRYKESLQQIFTTLEQLKHLDLYKTAAIENQRRLESIIESVWRNRMDLIGISVIQRSLNQSKTVGLSFIPLLQLEDYKSK